MIFQQYSKISIIGLFSAISVILGITENMIPFPIPGIRLGLANIAILLTLSYGTLKDAFIVALLKIFLVSLLSGNIIFRLTISFPSTIISLLAMAAMILLFRNTFSLISISAIGAFVHMFIQLFIMDKLFIKGILLTPILGVMLYISIISGILTGSIALIIKERIKIDKI